MSAAAPLPRLAGFEWFARSAMLSYKVTDDDRRRHAEAFMLKSGTRTSAYASTIPADALLTLFGEGVLLLPGACEQLARAARECCEHARILLRRSGAVLLTLAFHPSRPDERTTVHLWRVQDTHELGIEPLVSLPAGMHDLRVTMSRLLLAPAPIFRDLAERWPAGAVPEVLGLVSDGNIIAINQAEPSGLSTAWLAGHASGQQPATMIPTDVAAQKPGASGDLHQRIAQHGRLRFKSPPFRS